LLANEAGQKRQQRNGRNNKNLMKARAVPFKNDEDLLPPRNRRENFFFFPLNDGGLCCWPVSLSRGPHTTHAHSTCKTESLV
jgi:hypothetical protein